MVDDPWERGVVLHQEGRLREAALAYREAADAGDDDAWLGVAAVLLQEGGRDDEADEALAVLLDSEDDGLAGWAGELLGTRRWWVHGDADGARRALRVAVARGDDEIVGRAATCLGDLEACHGRVDEAMAAYEVAVATDELLSGELLARLLRARVAQWRRPRSRAAAMRVRRWQEERRRRAFADDWSPPSEWLER